MRTDIGHRKGGKGVGKRDVASRFGRASSWYHAHADVQRRGAEILAGMIRRHAGALPPGPVLEVGCGTGFISEHLCRIFPDRELELTDLSPEMVARCRANLAGLHSGGAVVRMADGERWEPGERPPSLVVAGFVAQWFDEPARGLVRLADALAPGGRLVVSVPVEGSFPEWHSAAELAGVPFTGHALPAAERLVGACAAAPFQVRSRVETLSETHERPLAFLRHLKRIGAGHSRTGASLSPTGLARLLRAWEETAGPRARITYRVLFMEVGKE